MDTLLRREKKPFYTISYWDYLQLYFYIIDICYFCSGARGPSDKTRWKPCQQIVKWVSLDFPTPTLFPSPHSIGAASPVRGRLRGQRGKFRGQCGKQEVKFPPAEVYSWRTSSPAHQLIKLTCVKGLWWTQPNTHAHIHTHFHERLHMQSMLIVNVMQ